MSNRHVQRLIETGPAVSSAAAPATPAQLRLGPVDDRYEREADRLARHAVSRNPPVTGGGSSPRVCARHPAEPAGAAVDPAVTRAIEAARSGGHPLPEEFRTRMEHVLGHDLGRVRVHLGTRVDGLNSVLRSRAFTVGADVFIRRGDYLPGTGSGAAVLAHELVHTIQQDVPGLAGAPVIQRHVMPMPDALRPPVITGDKQPWEVGTILTRAELAALKRHLVELIPADAQPSPVERVNALNYTDCATPGQMPAGYEGVAAKVTESGEIFFNNSLDDYYNQDGSPNIDKIRTTIVHESMHAVSANHTGLQDFADLTSPTRGEMTSPQHQPDESVTDYLSLKVYQAVFGEQTPYITAYWVPASSSVAAATDMAKKKLALDQQLPVEWTGQMIDILESVLGVDDDQLTSMYFTDPARFGQLVQGKEEEIRRRWNLLLGRETLAKHGVLSSDYKPAALDAVLMERVAELRRAGDDPARLSIVKEGLAAKNVPATTTPTGKVAVFSDPVIKRRVGEVLGRATESLPVELRDVTVVSQDLVKRLVLENNETALLALLKSGLFPLWTWEQDAWETFLEWLRTASSG